MTIRRSTLVALAALAAACVFSLSGWWIGWYGQVAWYDEAAHTAVPLGIAMVIAVLLDRRLSGAPAGPVLRATLVVCATLTIALLWELVEWIYDLLRASDVILGKHDTMTDLLFGGLGAIAGAALGMALTRSADTRARHVPAHA